MSEKKGYDWKKGLKKLGKWVGYVFIAGLVSTYGDNPAFLALAPAFAWAENYLKHR